MLPLKKILVFLSVLLILKSCITNSYQSNIIRRSHRIIERNRVLLLVKQENRVSCSTVVAPPKVDKTKKKGVGIEAPITPNIFKENRDIQKEFDNYGNEDKYAVILYNDPFNKRIFVATCLMEVFSWTEEMAAGYYYNITIIICYCFVIIYPVISIKYM